MTFTAEEIREMGFVKAYGVCENDDCPMSNHDFQSHHPEDRRMTCVECYESLTQKSKIVIEDASEKLGIDLEDKVLQKFIDEKESSLKSDKGDNE